ncbi:MAG: hypothetical protein ATN35_06355 [Epulopiscium sp. Nele67-Bin004]|nr:MAG: hypothetical protein ATN35_06355 [Epulopiscium sp. Nele67-Bin004]
MIKKEDQQQLMVTALTGVGVVVAVSVFQNIDTGSVTRQMNAIVSNRSTSSDTATAGSGLTSQSGGMTSSGGSSSGGSSSGGSSSGNSSGESSSSEDSSEVATSENTSTSSEDEAGLKKFEASDSNMTVTPLVVDDIIAYGEIIDINDFEVAILFDERISIYSYDDKEVEFSVGDYVIITKDDNTTLLRDIIEF